MLLKTAKKTLVFLVIVAMTFSSGLFLSGCRSTERNPDIVVTIFPIYDWTRVVLGDNPGDLTVSYLLSSGVDLHSYQPTIQDVAAISTTRLFIYVGGYSDAWVLNAMNNPVNQDRRHIALMEHHMPPAEPTSYIGITPACGDGLDEHVWMSLILTKIFVNLILEEVILLDPDNEATYRANATAYIQELTDLHNEFKDFVATIPAGQRNMVLSDRNPFSYLAMDYDITFLSPFEGCSAVSADNIQIVAQLVEMVNVFDATSILYLDSQGRALADIVARDSGRSLTFHRLECFQSVSRYHIDNHNVSYLAGMRANLETLKAVLGAA